MRSRQTERPDSGAKQERRLKTGFPGAGQGWARPAVSIASAVLLILLYAVIWGFSAEDSGESSGRSIEIAERIVEVIETITHPAGGGGWSEAWKESLAAYFEHPIRKLAHFTEYACMGVLLYGIWRPWRAPRRRLFGFSALWVFLSAATDELHQTFVPGRDGNFPDVLLDTCGGICGLLLIWLLADRWILQKRKKDERK